MGISALTLGLFKDNPFSALDAEIPPSVHPHPRARIRHHGVARMRAAAAQPARVLDTAKVPTALDDLPAILFYLLRESAPTPFGSSPDVIQRTAYFVAHAVGVERELPPGVPLQDIVDAFARVLEVVLLNDRGPDGTFFGGEAADCELGETDIRVRNEGESIVMHARVVVRVTYQDEIAVPADDVLQVMNINWDLAPRDGQLEAQDRVVLPVHTSLAGAFRLVGDLTATIG